MRLTREKYGSTLFIDGRFTFQRHKEFTSSLEQAISPLIIDLSQTEYVDSAALGMMLIARERKGPVTLRGATGTVKDTLQIASFNKIFTIV